MDTPDHTIFHEWLDLEMQGELEAPQREKLHAHLASCASCRAEGRTLEALDTLLGESRVPVRRGFQAQVMASLPVAGWESRSPRAWRVPLVLLALLGVITAGLVGVSSAQLRPDASFVGALAAVADLLGTAALAGAGLLAASWKGIGLVTVEALSATTGGIVAFVVLVVCLHLLLFSLLRRRLAATATSGRKSLR